MLSFPRLTGSILAGAMTCAMLGATAPATSASAALTPATAGTATGTDDGRRDRLGPLQRRALRERGTVMGRPGQTSDGARPGFAKPLPRGARATTPVVTTDSTYEIAPGLTIREWDQTDHRGPVRANLLTVDLNAPNISLDYLGAPYAVRRQTVSQMGTAAGTIGAVNGDFFDISDTGAALGVGVDRERGLVQGSETGWIPENASFYLDAAGQPQIGPLATRAKLRQRPRWPVSGVNAPTVAPDSIGLYTSDWGWTKGYSVTDGEAKKVREVVVVGGRIVSNSHRLSKGRKVKGQVMVARGKSAALLKSLKVGRKATFKYRSKPGATVAVSGDRPLLLNGVRTVVNDRLLHPRTAVGVDVDGRKLLFLVIDGRSEASRGYTMVELANMMQALGADSALNLDGGGSSTLFSRKATGEMGVINEPSDGLRERKVANGLGIFYAGELPPSS
ncbi:phosphodiester glycosidase family protein [Nocardioides piscis]|uniref:Phosphodiester glycosidase family protein n=1 Tax=Nocardioides piscis TaxID=2714938 RepID=A0A6G7YC78_9ACTN|nr:phosphodiester glycosidase family protein [Nocardioides piscis]QIK74329.1 phosphodiester glycosidase family protein [Nocardioides piscis]